MVHEAVERLMRRLAGAHRYPPEELDSDYDDGTMPRNVEQLADAVIGRRIVRAAKETVKYKTGYSDSVMILELDNGTRVTLEDTADCCAYTMLEDFFTHPEMVDHAILGVGTTDGYSTWHIYADFGDVMRLKVGWSAGNPFYYGYGFHIRVRELHDGD